MNCNRYRLRKRGESYLWPVIDQKHEKIRAWVSSGIPLTSYLKLDNANSNSITQQLPKILQEVCVSPFLTPVCAKEEISLSTNTYVKVTNLLPPFQLDCIKSYLLSSLYQREIGAARAAIIFKKRGIRVEGEADCGISYKDMAVAAEPMHPVTRYLTEAVNRYFKTKANSVQIAVCFPPSEKDSLQQSQM